MNALQHAHLNIKKTKSKVLSLERLCKFCVQTKKKFGFEQIFWSEKNLGLTKFWVRKEFEFENLFGSNKISGLKTLDPNKILGLEKKEVLPKNICWSKKILTPKKFGQNRTSNS